MRPETNHIPTAVKWIAAVATVALGGYLSGAVLDLSSEPAGLTPLVRAHMAVSGVDHPVTAVLLNFRGYDTWLEIGVLLIAIMGVLLFQRRNDLTDIRAMPEAEPVLDWLIKLLFPMMVLVSGYLLWMGKYSSGGAFQAGVVLGAGCVLLWLAGHRSLTALSGLAFRTLLVVGFAAFLVTGIVALVFDAPMLSYPVAYAGDIILLIEGAATLSIAVIVAALIIGLQPVLPPRERDTADHVADPGKGGRP